MRKYYFGKHASTKWKLSELESSLEYFHNENIDIRNYDALTKIFQKYNSDIELVIHAAAQPSHDWAAKEPLTDFTVNANGTQNMLEVTRLYAPDAVFIFTSTNKVYGDKPNYLPLIEQETRWEIEEDHPYSKNGIDEKMGIDDSKHSIFGVSKLAADIMTQEYGKYFGLKTVVFRGGCLTGPNHSGIELHGFLAYLMKCAVTKEEYTIYGYKGKQLRDNIHSCDLVNAFDYYYANPRIGEVYNIGGSRYSHCSLLEAIKLCETISGNIMKIHYLDSIRMAIICGGLAM